MCISISIHDLDQDPARGLFVATVGIPLAKCNNGNNNNKNKTSLQVRVALTKEVKQQIMEEWRELCQQQGSRNIPRLVLSTWQDLN
jgi:hypothetical protein